MKKKLVVQIIPVVIIALAVFLRFYQLDSVPPGISFDEAMNGVDAQDVINNGYHPLYFERNTGGREPLFIYLTTASVWIWGATPYALRLVPAFIGVLTVAAAYALAKNMFGYRPAVIASSVLALSDWHLHFSRTSLRAVSFPLLETLTFLFLWKGITSGRDRYFGLGGIFAGLTMYTYYSSRVFPVLLFLFFVYLGVFRRDKVSWRGIGLFCAIGIVVFAPLGLYYMEHQNMVFTRMDQVNAFSQNPQNPMAGLWQSTSNTLGMFNKLGDVYWKYNLPGKPVFDFVGFALLIAGIAVAVFRARRHPAFALMMIWLIVMLLPGALSVDSPSFIRTLGIIPAVFILPALGADEIWSKLTSLIPRHRTLVGGFLALGVVIWLGFTGMKTLRDYFVEWGTRREVYYATDTYMTDIGRFINSSVGSEPIFLSSKYYLHPSVLLFLSRPFDITWFNGSQSLVIPDYDREVIYILPNDAMPPETGKFFPSKDIIATLPGPENTTASTVYRTSPADLRSIATATIPQVISGGNFSDTVDLLRFSAGSEVKPGGVLPLTILSSVKQKPAPNSDMAFLSHLVDDQYKNWGVGDGNEYPSSEWEPGMYVVGHYNLNVRSDTPPGRYFIEVGVYDRRTGERLYLPGGGKHNTVLLTPVQVQ